MVFQEQVGGRGTTCSGGSDTRERARRGVMALTKCAVYLIGMLPALRTKPEVGGGGRYYTQRRLARAAKKLGIAELAVHDQLEDRRVGLRMVVFTGPVHDLGAGVQARQ